MLVPQTLWRGLLHLANTVPCARTPREGEDPPEDDLAVLMARHPLGSKELLSLLDRVPEGQAKWDTQGIPHPIPCARGPI